jgi:hypothetical protein
MAILMHDMPSLYWGNDMDTPPDNDHIRLRLHVDPLSCVVALADVLQDFCRVVAAFDDDSDSGNHIDVRYPSACESVELEQSPHSPDTLRIIYHMGNENDLADKRNRMHKELRQYFDHQHGYLDFSSAGIARFEMEATL